MVDGLMSNNEPIDPLFPCDAGNTVASTDDFEFTNLLPRVPTLAKINSRIKRL